MKEDIPYVDVICGGFPCQPVSCAGKRKGKEDERWLWPEFYRIVCEVKPRWVLVENVPGLLSADSGWLFAGILRDLASSGYDAEWNIVSAASVGAPHLRKRVFVVAHTGQPGRQQISGSSSGNEATDERRPQEEDHEFECNGQSSRERSLADPNQIGRHGRAGVFGQGRWRESEDGGAESANTDIEGLAKRDGGDSERGSCLDVAGSDGGPAFGRLGRTFTRISEGLDEYWRPGWEDGTPRLATGQKDRVNRLKALGNAIVPQCAEVIGRQLLDMEASL